MTTLQPSLPGFDAVPAQQPSPTWTLLIEQYLQARQSDAAKSSLISFRRDLECLAELFPGRDPTTLTTPEAGEAIRRVQAKSAVATARRRHGTWRVFYQWLMAQGLIAESPFVFEFSRTTPRSFKPPRFLSPVQAKTLLDAAAEKPGALFLIRLVLQTGIKQSELKTITVGDLDEQGNLVTIRGRRQRAVPVQSDLFAAYDAFVEDELPARPGKDEPAIPFTIRWAELRVAEVARQTADDIGFAPTFQTLRWTRAVWDLRNGVSEERVRIKLGYSRLGWEIHARPALLPWIPGDGEGQMPKAA